MSITNIASEVIYGRAGQCPRRETKMEDMIDKQELLLLKAFLIIVKGSKTLEEAITKWESLISEAMDCGSQY